MQNKNGNKLKKISFVILFIFSLIGVIIFDNIIHENIHKRDYRSVNKTDESICYLNGPLFDLSEPAGYYELAYLSEYKEQVKEITKYTEIKAYTFSFFIFFIYTSCLVIVIWGEAIKDLKKKMQWLRRNKK